MFDGGSMVFDAEGELVARSPQFVEDLLIVDLDIDPVYRKRLLDPRGRPTDDLLPVEVIATVPVDGDADGESGSRADRPALAPPTLAAPLDPAEEVFA